MIYKNIHSEDGACRHTFTDEEKEALREQMLEAGFPLLKQYGMTHTSVAKITQAAGIAVGTFYSFWKNKEAYMADLIGYHRRKLMPVLIGEDALMGKKKLGREDARRYLYAVIDEEISIYPHMTLEDEAKLFFRDKGICSGSGKGERDHGGAVKLSGTCAGGRQSGACRQLVQGADHNGRIAGGTA